MTAVSPYAPHRRQSSVLAATGNDARLLRRTTSGIGASLSVCWILVNYYWRRIVSRRVDNGDKVSEEYQYGTLRRIFSSVIGLAREAAVRSIGVANIMLMGYPTPNHWEADIPRVADCFEPSNNGCNCFSNHRTMKTSSVDDNNIGVDMIKNDLKHIQLVLNFWFGHASPDEAQKELWMIASSSVDRLSQVDAVISHKFRSLIASLSSDSVKDCTGNTLFRWTEDVDLFGWQGKIAAIVALDQLSRHIHRHDKKHKGGFQPLPNQQQLDGIAYNIAIKLRVHHKNELSTGMIPLPMQVFGIMPLRHASTVKDLGIVQEDIEASSELYDEMDRMIRRFRKATNRRMAILQDEARRAGKLDLTTGYTNNHDTDRTKQHVEDEQILECFPFKADMSSAGDHIVVKTMTAFLSKMNILRISDARGPGSRKLANAPCDRPASSHLLHDGAISATENAPIKVPTAIVSLSGGVDSMVIASALAYLRDEEARRQNTDSKNILRIIAIHIDYGNRPESGSEAQYVGRYCHELGAEFVCRRIDEVTRGITARDDYERIARDIRFDLYRRCCAEAWQIALKGEVDDGEARIGIMLGHHRGDLRENVISNAHKGCGPLDLSGMTEASQNDGVTLFRPLLPLEKSHIFDYSHTYGVPYFKDTTPHWSTRGKLRNRLIPLLEEIYGEGSMDNLSSLAAESDEAKALVQEAIMSPFMKQVTRYAMGISFDTSSWKDRSLFFWKFVLRQVMHGSGLGMFSDKSVESFLERVRAISLREGWLQCRKDYAVYLRKDGRVFVFYPTSFPFGNGQGKDQFNHQTAFLGYGLDRSISVGPWTVTSEIIHAREEESLTMLETKAYRSLEHLMGGDIQYCLRVPMVSGTVPCPLVRTAGFTKPTRPAAWKGMDLKVESTLPLLGVDYEDSSDFQEGEMSFALVRVRLVLKSREANEG
jgi:tRNA(Ile)-lysidine synthetase-like protein